MRTTTSLAILVLALASVASAAPFTYLTINGEALDAITLRTGQTCTVEVVSTTSNEYEANVGFDDRVVLGIFDQPRVMFIAGGQASITKVDKTTFYGYHCIAEGTLPPVLPGVHFTIEYEPNQVGETDIKLYSGGFDALLDSIHVTILSGDMGTAFTYQGRLMEDGNPADGLHDFQFSLYNDANTLLGNQEGNTIDINDLDVIDGYFTVELDFGSDVFDGDARWLEIGVRPGEPSDPCEYTILSPRQEVTPVPYAIYAKNVTADNDWMVSGDNMYSIPSGNVGIGTSTPESKLQVEQSTGAWGEGIRLSYEAHAWDIVSDYEGERLTIAPDQDSTKGLVMRNGNAGIGEASPLTTLHVQGTDRALPATALSGDDIIAEDYTATLGLYTDNRAGHGSCVTLGEFVGDTGALTNKWGIYRMTGTSPALQFSFGTDRNFTANPTRLTITAGGGVGIGTTNPGLYKLNVQGGASGVRASGSTRAGHFEDSDGTSSVELAYGNYGIWANAQMHYFTGSVGIGNLIPGAELDVSGKTRTQVLEITGGSDLSEQFEIKAEQQKVEPGMVVCIDPASCGDLIISQKAYDRTVAGIVSGAGGIKPGMLMGQTGTMANGEHPVALTGRAYCWADASNDAIQPGDLLTTSSTPGHAMKVTDHNKAQGAIIGKAMTRLEKGKTGLVLVLVNLQ